MSTRCQIETPVGRLILVAGERGLAEVRFAAAGEAAIAESAPAPPLLRQAAAEIGEYFSGRRQRFSIDLDLEHLSPFAGRVVAALLQVPPGETVTYGELAARAGSPRAARAVGRVMASNRLPLVVPCHRVIGHNAAMTGYSGGEGIATKVWLLDFERRQMWQP